jgi:hypothetical protein
MPMMMTPIKGPDIERYISKCSVCETPTKEREVFSMEKSKRRRPNLATDQ